MGRVEKSVGKGENAGNQRLPFSPFPTMFSKGLFLKVIQSWDCMA